MYKITLSWSISRDTPQSVCRAWRNAGTTVLLYSNLFSQ